MSKKVKLLFDECIGWPAVEQLAALLGITGDAVELGHAVKMGFGGINDEVWIPRIARDEWIVVTGDRGRRKRPGTGEKLHRVCQQHGVTFAVLSRSYNERRVFEKLRIFVDVWDDLLALADAPKGAGFSIRPSSANRPIVVCHKPALPKADE